MNIPDYKESVENVKLGVATALEKFVCEYEPLMIRDALLWRRGLQEVVDYARNLGPELGMSNRLEYPDDTIPLPGYEEEQE